MMSFFENLFNTTDFPARWRCGKWSESHGWLHIASDLAIFGAYFAIPCLLAYFVLRRRDVPFPPVFWLFAAFILSCGIGHAIEASLFWNPWYRFSGIVKLITAVVSWATVIALVPSLPKALSLPGLAKVNEQLREEIARRERSEEAERRLTAQLLQAQKLESLGVLAGGIAHDFNNLLTSILGYADLASQDLPANAPARSSIDQVVSGSLRAAELTSQMLAYSGKGRVVAHPTRLDELVDGMLRLLRVSVPKKCELRHEAEPGQPSVDADPSQLRQVVMNLVINAAEAVGDHEGEILVRTGTRDCETAFLANTILNDQLPAGRYLQLEVTDTGSGMSPETLKKIFDPFFTTKFTGRGLGLAAVLGIVRGHRGALRVETELGRGTTFSIYLPTTTETIQVPLPPPPPRGRASGTVLLIDDEESVRLVSRDMLRSMGFTVDLAGDGAEGVDLFRRSPHKYDLVLLDLLMPKLDGVETLRLLRSIQADVRVILTSGYNEANAHERLVQAGHSGFIQKPFRVEQLRDEVERVLAARGAI